MPNKVFTCEFMDGTKKRLPVAQLTSAIRRVAPLTVPLKNEFVREMFHIGLPLWLSRGDLTVQEMVWLIRNAIDTENPAPAIVLINPDDTWKVVDGWHRLFTGFLGLNRADVKVIFLTKEELDNFFVKL